MKPMLMLKSIADAALALTTADTAKWRSARDMARGRADTTHATRVAALT